MKFIKEKWHIILLATLGFITRFAFLNYPAEVVFDEVHFGKYTNSYFTHNFEFFLHPPLAEMIFAGFARIFGYVPHCKFAQIGDIIDPHEAFLLRFMPALFGALLPLLIYFILRKIGISEKMAFLGGIFVIFDNAILVESRLIVTDVLLLFFGFLSFFLYLQYKDKSISQRKSILYFVLSVLSASFAFSIKWTAASFMGIIGLMMIVDTFKNRQFWNFILKSCLAVIIFFLTYYLIFWIHTAMLYNSGAGDAYTSSLFQQTLAKNSSVSEKMPQLNKFLELNKAMYFYNVSTLTATHPYSSKWYEWPFGKRPIWYWSGSKDGISANIYLFGNIIEWLLVLFGVIFAVFTVFIKKMRQELPSFFWFLLIGYFANLLPYLAIARVTFLYHYLPSLIFGIMIFCILLEKIAFPYLTKKFSSPKLNNAIYLGILIAVVVGFLVICPISYGIKISQNSNSHYSNFLNIFLNNK